MKRNLINMESIVDVVFHLKWRSDSAIHTDGYQASQVNIWRDYLPPFLVDKLKGKQAGERIDVKIGAEDVIPDSSRKNILQGNKKQIHGRPTAGEIAKPKVGRFYPKGILKGVDGVFSTNVQPFRCVGLNNGKVSVDFNHPLTGKKLTISALIGKVETNEIERGGSSVGWMETLTNGPGMQARWQGQQTDFFSGGGFRREDETPDSRFYIAPP